MKILIIGQAPPAKKQELPYDSTLLYEWLEKAGISKEEAQKIFIFDAIYNKFPGFNEKGGHKVPTKEQMDEYWPTLESKIQLSDKVWLLGKTASAYFHSKPKTWSCNLDVLETMHPSYMNYTRYLLQEKELIENIKNFIQCV